MSIVNTSFIDRTPAREANLWCMHCDRTFPARDARPDAFFGREGCAFEDCNAAGFGIDLFTEEEARAFCDDADSTGSWEHRDELLGIDSNDGEPGPRLAKVLDGEDER